ncbi:MAG TPA: ATP-binding protein [Solirubrobacter sp.]|nr:ATP-binding protein [Solirubrobacter sp.]
MRLPREDVESRAVAVVRAVLVVAIGAAALIDDRPGLYSTTFIVGFAVAAVYAALALAVGRLAPGWLYAAADLVLLALLAHASGGAASEVRFAFFALPVLAALLLRPYPTALASVAVVAVYSTLALTHPAGGERLLVAVELVYLVWTGVAAVLLSTVLTRRADTIAELARARGVLALEVLEAGERERRRLADWLHDGAVQDLLVVSQDLAEAERGDLDAIARARAIVRDTVPELRSVLVDLHPGLLTTTGLTDAMHALAEAQARRGGFRVTVRVDAGADSRHDQLLLSLARELLLNVIKHAHASAAEVSVTSAAGAITLEVADDGRGMDVGARSAALAAGHIGLASATERVEAAGGTLELTSAPGQGTRVRVTLPA